MKYFDELSNTEAIKKAFMGNYYGDVNKEITPITLENFMKLNKIFPSIVEGNELDKLLRTIDNGVAEVILEKGALVDPAIMNFAFDFSDEEMIYICASELDRFGQLSPSQERDARRNMVFNFSFEAIHSFEFHKENRKYRNNPTQEFTKLFMSQYYGNPNRKVSPVSAKELNKFISNFKFTPGVFNDEKNYDLIDNGVLELLNQPEWATYFEEIQRSLKHFNVADLYMSVTILLLSDNVSNKEAINRLDWPLRKKMEFLINVKKDSHVSELPFYGYHEDNRGSHQKFYTSTVNTGQNALQEVFMTTNNKGTVRGMHRQLGENTQQKLIKAVNGSFNVRVIVNFDDMDLKMYPKVEDRCNYILDEELNVAIYEYNNVDEFSAPIFVPARCLLGYVALEDNSKMIYMADDVFNGAEDDGFSIHSCGLDWGYDGEIILSDRDKAAPMYKAKK